MKVKVVCPVCREGLEYEDNREEMYGIISIDDLACAELTIVDETGKINKHLTAHREDESYIEALKKHAVDKRAWADQLDKYFS